LLSSRGNSRECADRLTGFGCQSIVASAALDYDTLSEAVGTPGCCSQLHYGPPLSRHHDRLAARPSERADVFLGEAKLPVFDSNEGDAFVCSTGGMMTQSIYAVSHRAAVLSDFGEPSNILVRDVPTPVLRSDEMLVRVKATSVNPIECKMRRGFGLPKPIWRQLIGQPMILGMDFSGIVCGGRSQGRRLPHWRRRDGRVPLRWAVTRNTPWCDRTIGTQPSRASRLQFHMLTPRQCRLPGLSRLPA
jgi:hypothetical protein